MGLWLVCFERKGCELVREREEWILLLEKGLWEGNGFRGNGILESWKVLGLWRELKCMNRMNE